MPVPQTRQDLINYCMRRLGAPVIEINVDPDQVEDRIDDAILFCRDFHMDFVEKVYLAHCMTAQDIANQFIQIPPPVISVTRIVPVSNNNRSMGMFDIQYQMRLNDLYTFTSTSILHYHVMQQHLALLNFEFNVDSGILFSRHQQELRILQDWSTVAVGDYYIIECYRILDPNEFPDVWNDRFLKSYATELIRRQFGENLIKYNGVALLGGVTLNGSDIYQRALENIAKLEEECKTTYMEPINFLVG